MQTNRKTALKTIIILLSTCFATASLSAQNIRFKIHNIKLPIEIQNPDHEFSGLYISGEKLFLLPENRLNKGEEGKLYVIQLSDLDWQLKDSTYPLAYSHIYIPNLRLLQQKINGNGQAYEGLEAILVKEDSIYLSVETTTPSTFAYLLKGHLQDSILLLDTQFILPVRKPVRTDGSQIYNAGFESLEGMDKGMILFYEYNSFPEGNDALGFEPPIASKKNRPLPLITGIPFRLTDITRTAMDHYTGINYFYKGEGPDTLYRPAKQETMYKNLVNNDSGYHNYCRLIDIEIKDYKLSWKSLWEFPSGYQSYNWEGIATYKNGYFIINDRYTPEKPYSSTLIYLNRED